MRLQCAGFPAVYLSAVSDDFSTISIVPILALIAVLFTCIFSVFSYCTIKLSRIFCLH